MRLLHVISSFKQGGAETVLASVITHSLFNNDDHFVIFFHDGPLKQRLQKNNITVYHIPYGPLFLVRFLYRLLSINPDCIHAHLWCAMVVSSLCAWITSLPLLVVFHNHITQNASWKNKVDWLFLRQASDYIAVSQSVAHSVYTYHTWLPAKSITVIHNGIDLPAPDCNAIKALPDHPSCVIGTVGRFESVKRYTWLLDCFAQLCTQKPHVKLMVVGTGTQEQMLKSYAKKKGIQEQVVWFVDQDAHRFYAAFDIFTLTSAQEGLSMALLEAMSYAKPAVITHNELTHPVINHYSNGILIPAKDKKQFITSLSFLIDNHSLRTQLGQRAQQDVHSLFSRDRMVTHYYQRISLLCYKSRAKP